MLFLPEGFDQWCKCRGVGEKVDVSAVVQVHGYVRQQPPHHSGVDDRDDGIVSAGDDQGGLANQRQREQAAPR